MGFISDMFGDDDNNQRGRRIETTHIITKQEFCEALGFEDNKVVYINYDYTKKEFTIKVKE